MRCATHGGKPAGIATPRRLYDQPRGGHPDRAVSGPDFSSGESGALLRDYKNHPVRLTRERRCSPHTAPHPARSLRADVHIRVAAGSSELKLGTRNSRPWPALNTSTRGRRKQQLRVAP